MGPNILWELKAKKSQADKEGDFARAEELEKILQEYESATGEVNPAYAEKRRSDVPPGHPAEVGRDPSRRRSPEAFQEGVRLGRQDPTAAIAPMSIERVAELPPEVQERLSRNEGFDFGAAWTNREQPARMRRKDLMSGYQQGSKSAIREAKLKAGYNSLTTEMINKKNSGDK